MDYRKLYLKIVGKAKKEQEGGIRFKGNGNYYESHHIFPKSLFPLWKDKKSNLVLLTAREHFFCHQLLTKIWPSPQMNFAIAAFLWGVKKESTFNKRKSMYKITSREYERIRKSLGKEFKDLQKQKWKKRDEKWVKNWLAKQLKTKSERTKEQKESTKKKLQETLSKRTFEEWEKIKEKIKNSRENKSEEEKRILSEKLSLNIKGKKWFNNGKKEILCFECPNGFIKGRIPDPESRKKAGQTNKERNKTRGTSFDRMTQEEKEEWISKIKASKKKNPRNIYKEMSEERKKERNEKISKSLKGKKFSDEKRRKISEGNLNSPKHKSAVEKIAAAHRGKKFYNNGVICILAEECPPGFVQGILRKKQKEN